MLNQQEYKARLEKTIKAQQKNRLKKQAELYDPIFQQAQQAKQKSYQLKVLEKQKQKLQTPEYREQLLEKTQLSYERQKIKQQEKLKNQSVQVIDFNRQHNNSSKVSDEIKPAKTLIRNSLKGRIPTPLEKRLQDKIGNLGCVCCINQNWYTSAMQASETTKYISLHHVNGRTKPHCHAQVLPLCAKHHDQPAINTDPKQLFPLHGSGRKRWEAVNGSQIKLLKQVYQMINEDIPWQSTTINNY